MKTGIYMIRNKINDKKYIGQAVDIDFRWATHIRELNDNKHNNRYLQNSWNKYGADNFEFTIVCLCEEEELDDFEIDMIAHYHTFYRDGGYNLTLGGDGVRGYKFTDEQRAKRSEAFKGDKNPAKRHEVKARLSESMKEYYKDPENRKKKSEAIKEAMNRPEVKAKMSEANYRRWSDPEYKAKMSEAMNRPEVKAKISESMKEAMKGKNAKAVYCVTNDTIYASTVEAEEKLNIPGASTVSWACKGKYRWGNGHVYKKLGLEFWYLSEYEEKFGKVAM